MDKSTSDQSNPTGEPLSMLPYAGLFLGVYATLAASVGVLVLFLGMKRPSWIGLIAIYVASSIVGWRFAKKHQRLFLPVERRRLTALCLAAVLLFEVFGFVGYPEMFRTLSQGALIGIVAFAVGLDALVVWLVFKRPVERQMTRQLERYSAQPPNNALERTRNG